MTHRSYPSVMKRKLLGILAGLPLLAACSTRGARRGNSSSDEDVVLRNKFRGVRGLVWRLDALTPKQGVEITTDKGQLIAARSTISPRNVSHLTYTDSSAPIPNLVRATWREGEFKSVHGAGWEGGAVVGDYTVRLAERIPDEVLDYVRSGGKEPYWVGTSVEDGSDVYATPIGRALRIKIRLLDDGVLIGWDVEERIRTRFGTGLRYKMAGGDFREAQIHNGKVIEKGWYINERGEKIETDV